MTYFLGTLLLLAGAFLVWLVVTHRWKFQLLFEFGMALLAAGIVVNGLCVLVDDAPNLRAWIAAGVGAALMLVSYFRESRRKPELGSIERRIMRGPR